MLNVFKLKKEVLTNTASPCLPHNYGFFLSVFQLKMSLPVFAFGSSRVGRDVWD